MLKDLIKGDTLEFVKSHLFLSIIGSALGILSTAAFFILISRYLDQVFLAKFSISILFFFSILQISLLGLDQNIIAHSKTLYSQKIIFDKKAFLLIGSLTISLIFFSIIFKLKEIFIIEIYLNDFIILNIAVIIALICRVLQAYLQSSSKLLENARTNFIRYTGYAIFIIFWLKNTQINILYFFLFSELLALLYLVYRIFFCIGFNYSKSDKKLNLKYLYLGISQFSYESLFKLDLLTISIFGTQKLLILYTILSNIIEGIINFLSVTHPMVHNFMNKHKINKVETEEQKLMKYINYFSIMILLMILPAYIVFNFAVFLEFPKKDLFLIACFFAVLLIFFRKVFLFFFFFSINNKPLSQFSYSILMAISNLALNIILFQIIGVYGIAIATLLVYFFANLFIRNRLKKYKSHLNFV